MGLVQILVVWGLASVSPFSIAQEFVSKGNSVAPHQPPIWFARMAVPEPVFSAEIDGFTVAGIQDRRPWYGVPTQTGGKYACNPKKNEKGVLVWQFCEM